MCVGFENTKPMTDSDFFFAPTEEVRACKKKRKECWAAHCLSEGSQWLRQPTLWIKYDSLTDENIQLIVGFLNTSSCFTTHDQLIITTDPRTPEIHSRFVQASMDKIRVFRTFQVRNEKRQGDCFFFGMAGGCSRFVLVWGVLSTSWI